MKSFRIQKISITLSGSEKDFLFLPGIGYNGQAGKGRGRMVGGVALRETKGGL